VYASRRSRVIGCRLQPTRAAPRLKAFCPRTSQAPTQVFRQIQSGHGNGLAGGSGKAPVLRITSLAIRSGCLAA
jgi:hypothetical protein